MEKLKKILNEKFEGNEQVKGMIAEVIDWLKREI